MHWPFCEAKCPYCDFNSHVSREIDQTVWRDAYLSEIARIGAQTQGRLLNAIFFGGGTPSLMHPDTVAAVIDAAQEQWTFANDIEITLEANPGSVEASRFAGYRDGGVNRISMGVQALNDDDLRRLGRIHTVAEARAAFDIARGCFDRVSFDLIYARQNQTLSDWERELREALSMAVDHLSMYQLTIEPGTAFGDRYDAGKLRGLPDDDSSADMFLRTQDICNDFGMPAYEVSNHAAPGSESRHNLIYWRYGDYVGIGPGAHGRLTLGGQKYATECARAPGQWLNDVSQGAGDTSTILTGSEQAAEFLMMGLRLSEPLDLIRYETLGGEAISPTVLSPLQDLGFIRSDSQQIRVTLTGRPVLNAIIRELLTG